MANPEIRLRFSRLMYEKVSWPLIKHYRGENAELMSVEDCRQKVELYRQAWGPAEDQIVSALSKLTGLTFYLPVIDVTLAPMIPSFSAALQINLKSEPAEFVDILTHDLIHILLNDNQQQFDYRALLAPYESEDVTAANHVFVHALHQVLYLDILKSPDRLALDRQRCQDNPPYVRAWEIVDQIGADELVGQITGNARV